MHHLKLAWDCLILEFWTFSAFWLNYVIARLKCSSHKICISSGYLEADMYIFYSVSSWKLWVVFTCYVRSIGSVSLLRLFIHCLQGVILSSMMILPATYILEVCTINSRIGKDLKALPFYSSFAFNHSGIFASFLVLCV